MKRFMLAAAAVLTAAGLIAGTGLPAQATPVAVPAANTAAKVTINKITTKRASAGKKAVVKPVVRSSGNVKVSSKTLTVRQGSKTLARNVGQARLKAGKYSVTTTVKYKTWSTKSVRKKVETEKLFAVDCKVTDVDTVSVGDLGLDLSELDGLGIDPAVLDFDAVSIACTGDFAGVYETAAAHYPHTDFYKQVGPGRPVHLADRYPKEPSLTPRVGAKFSTKMYPVGHIRQTAVTDQDVPEEDLVRHQDQDPQAEPRGQEGLRTARGRGPVQAVDRPRRALGVSATSGRCAASAGTPGRNTRSGS